MLVGLANRSLSVIVRVPGPVAKTADAFTDPLEVALPDGVTNVIVVPDAIPKIVRAVASRRTAKIFQLVLINVSSSALPGLVTSDSPGDSMAAGAFKMNWMGFQIGHLEQIPEERSRVLERLPQERGVLLHVRCTV